MGSFAAGSEGSVCDKERLRVQLDWLSWRPRMRTGKLLRSIQVKIGGV